MAIHTRHGAAEETRLARLLFSDLADELDRALGQSAGGNGAPEQGSLAHVDKLLNDAARDARNGEFGRAAFEGVAAPQVERLERAFASARTVASWAGLDLPEPEAFWGLGLDRVAIARALLADPTLLPVPAPHGLGESGWTTLFRAAARQPGSPLSLGSPMTLAAEVAAAFAELDVVPDKTPALRSDARGGSGAAAGNDAVQWTLRLIPAGPFPSRTDVSHTFGPHPTLPEMLMLQLMLIAVGEAPVDRHSFTWLSGAFAGGRFAARHFFDTAVGSVGVNAREIGNQGPHLGTRAPIGR